MNAKKSLIVILILVLIYSCKKEPLNGNFIKHDLNSSGSSSLFGIDDEELYDSVLIAAYWGVLELSKVQSFKDSVSSIALREFDGDVNVLFDKINDIWPTLENDMESSINMHHPDPTLILKFLP